MQTLLLWNLTPSTYNKPFWEKSKALQKLKSKRDLAWFWFKEESDPMPLFTYKLGK